MKVYIVTDGDYSDYHIVAVFSTQAKADECVATMKRANKECQDAEERGDFSLDYFFCDDPRVTVFDLDPGNERVSLYCIAVDGEGRETNREVRLRYPWQRDDETRCFGAGGAVGVSPRGYEVALKAARDALYEWKARQAGIAP